MLEVLLRKRSHEVNIPNDNVRLIFYGSINERKEKHLEKKKKILLKFAFHKTRVSSLFYKAQVLNIVASLLSFRCVLFVLQ